MDGNSREGTAKNGSGKTKEEKWKGKNTEREKDIGTEN